ERLARGPAIKRDGAIGFYVDVVLGTAGIAENLVAGRGVLVGIQPESGVRADCGWGGQREVEPVVLRLSVEAVSAEVVVIDPFRCNPIRQASVERNAWLGWQCGHGCSSKSAELRPAPFTNTFAGRRSLLWPVSDKCVFMFARQEGSRHVAFFVTKA